MTGTANNNKETWSLIIRAMIMFGISLLVGMLAHSMGLSRAQIISCSTFIMIIMATLLFWGHAELIDSFLAAARGTGKPPVSIEDAPAIVALKDGILAAAGDA